ncbi:alpha/beta hydrolase [Humibacter soli]
MGRVTTDATAVTVDDLVLDGPHGPLPVRVYRAAASTGSDSAGSGPTSSGSSGPGLVWLHGGGFSAGDLDMPEADWVSRGFAERGITVVSVGYRLAPNPSELTELLDKPVVVEGVHYPVPLDEAAFAFRWAAASDLAAGPWALGGASAGGNIATGTALRLANEAGAAAASGSVPALAVLAYPTLLAVQPKPDAALRAALDADPEADRFGPVAVARMYQNYLGAPLDAAPAADLPIYAVPGLATASDLALFPPTIMINDEIDELRVSGEAFATSLQQAGVEVDATTAPGMRHGHLNRPEEPEASASLDRFAARITALTEPIANEVDEASR